MVAHVFCNLKAKVSIEKEIFPFLSGLLGSNTLNENVQGTIFSTSLHTVDRNLFSEETEMGKEVGGRSKIETQPISSFSMTNNNSELLFQKLCIQSINEVKWAKHKRLSRCF